MERGHCCFLWDSGFMHPAGRLPARYVCRKACTGPAVVTFQTSFLLKQPFLPYNTLLVLLVSLFSHLRLKFGRKVTCHRTFPSQDLSEDRLPDNLRAQPECFLCKVEPWNSNGPFWLAAVRAEGEGWSWCASVHLPSSNVRRGVKFSCLEEAQKHCRERPVHTTPGARSPCEAPSSWPGPLWWGGWRAHALGGG
jgi:hypothetical protein